MAGIGWANPFPLQFGGEPTEIENVYVALRSAAGKGGTARSEDAIEAKLRQAEALGIGLVASMDVRAANQAFANLATDLLPYYERTLRLPPDPDASEERRRELVTSRWTATADTLIGEIEAALQRIDSRFSILTELWDPASSTATLWGAWFEPYDGSAPFGDRKATAFPNYSTDFIVPVLFDIDGLPTPEDERSLAAARSHLAESLPAWMTFSVVYGLGFELDIDRLDVTALSP